MQTALKELHSEMGFEEKQGDLVIIDPFTDGCKVFINNECKYIKGDYKYCSDVLIGYFKGSRKRIVMDISGIGAYYVDKFDTNNIKFEKMIINTVKAQ